MSANGFINFVNKSLTPFHVVSEMVSRLEACGFKSLKQHAKWKLDVFSKYYVTINSSCIIAFTTGDNTNHVFSMVGAHTDSPCLRLKPNSFKQKENYSQLGVQLYGGGLWHTWFDRDLGLSGRIFIRSANGGLMQKLVSINEPILKIPNLAIHLSDRSVKDSFSYNTETHLVPILSAQSDEELFNTPKVLMNLIAQHANVKPEDIVETDLYLHDVQPSVIGGIQKDLVFAPRCDNLGMTYCGLEALIQFAQSSEFKTSKSVNLLVCFDNEEVGSLSVAGADSQRIQNVLAEIAFALEWPFEQAMSKSFFISADMAHAVHPNYADKHELDHKPKMNKGVVLKYNANQRYATNGLTASILKECAHKYQLKNKDEPILLQSFVVRNDSACGSTIGPITAGQLGVHTIDIGCPQLGMHSIRETMGTEDIVYAVRLIKSVFINYPGLSEAWDLDSLSK
eukprot:NODE_165_length_16345_cov_0.329743.p2 type:complete len:453 gc:universal NODE_165_length_16345_cov_0.329743:6983-8341(+)